MKKVLVFVVAVLAFAGMATLAYADVTIFQDSQVYPFANWQGANQANYGTATQPNTHSISDSVVISPFIGAASNPDPAGNYVIKIDYNMATLALPAVNEAWSGHLMTASPGASLNGITQFNCKVRADLNTTGSAVINKIAVSDSSGGLINVAMTYPVLTNSWSSVVSDAGAFTGKNMSAVPTPFGIYMTASDNSGVSNTSFPNHVIVYVDDIKFTGGSSGAVRVTMTTGVVGVQVENTINFDLLGSLTPDTSRSSSEIGGIGNANSHFVVTNIGSATDTADYDLSLVNPGGWTAVDPGANADIADLSATDTYAIWGLFSAAIDAPPAALTEYGAEDVITTALKLSTASVYSYPGTSGNGVDVPAGASGIRNLWICLHMPPLSTTQSTQQIMIGVTALKH